MRCLNIADYCKKNKSIFFIETSSAGDQKKAKIIMEKFIHKYYFFKKLNITKELNIIKKINSKEKSILFIDFSNSNKIKKKNIIKKYISNLSIFFTKTIFLDSIGKESILEKLDCDIDTVITPYLGAKKNRRYKCHFYGSKYFIIKKNKFLKKKNIKKKIKNFIITSGQTDPNNLMVNFLKKISKDLFFFSRYNIKLVIGQGYKKSYIKYIKSLVNRIDLNITLIENCSDLAKHFFWADVGLSTNGLTKYEFAKYKISSILVSFNLQSHKLQKYFNRYHCSFYLGLASKFSLSNLKNKLLIYDRKYNQRFSMIMKGYNLIDFKGLERVSKIINE